MNGVCSDNCEVNRLTWKFNVEFEIDVWFKLPIVSQQAKASSLPDSAWYITFKKNKEDTPFSYSRERVSTSNIELLILC